MFSFNCWKSTMPREPPHTPTCNTAGKGFCRFGLCPRVTMVRRRGPSSALAAAAFLVCLCHGKVAAAGVAGSMEYFGPTTSTGAAPPANDAQRIRQQATALHRAGEYEEAAREFARAADLLESTGVGLAPPALSAIRLSLAAAQLKSGDLSGAEATCSQLLGTPGLARPLRQKASYRRAMARQRQVDMEGTTEDAGSRLARKAYRDAYLSVKLSQGGEGAGLAEGDAKAVILMKEMETGDWGETRLTEADRVAAQSKADQHLASLASAPVAQASTPAGGLFDMLGGIGGSPGAASGGLGGLPGLDGNGAMGGIPGLINMMGAGGGGSGQEGMGDGLMSMLMGAAGGAGAGAGGTRAGGVDKAQMLKMAKKMSKVVKKQLRNPGTQQFVCSFLKQAEPETLKSLAGAAGFPANEVIITKVSTYLKEADGKTLESWIDFGEIASGVYRRLSQLAVLWSRGIALAGVWLVWVWLRACFAPIVLTGAKA